MNTYHNTPTAGHCGIDRTIARITPRYYWKRMRKKIETYVKKCIDCQKLKPAGLLKTVSSSQRFEILSVDLFGPLPVTEHGYKWILIADDLASRWVELFALKEATAENCATTLLNEVFLRYGTPRRILTDNGPQFVSAIMQCLTYRLNITQPYTSVYHPQANPVE